AATESRLRKSLSPSGLLTNSARPVASSRRHLPSARKGQPAGSFVRRFRARGYGLLRGPFSRCSADSGTRSRRRPRGAEFIGWGKVNGAGLRAAFTGTKKAGRRRG